MPTLVRTNQTKADLLQRKLEINSELRELRNHYDKPGVVKVPGDRQRVDDLIARHTPGDARCFRDQMRSRTPMRHQRFPSCGPSSWLLSVRSPLTGSPGPRIWILSPLAWAWLRAALDTAGRPLFAVGGSETETGMNAMGTAQGGGAGDDVNGRMLGCDVVISGNVPETLVAARMRPASSPQTCATCTCGSYPPVLSSFELSSRTPRASASATWRTGTARSAPATEGDLRLCPARE